MRVRLSIKENNALLFRCISSRESVGKIHFAEGLSDISASCSFVKSCGICETDAQYAFFESTYPTDEGNNSSRDRINLIEL